MAKYYVNKNAQTNGDHEVHKEGCSYMPNSWNLESLGEHATCSSAVSAAKAKGYRTADGCYHCCNACHHR
ncbi:hypothetical protein OAT16_06675 [Prolixibacteraceae bacterium]|nr:hypothetical protein [Prolixibacteraceae bacterium]